MEEIKNEEIQKLIETFVMQTQEMKKVNENLNNFLSVFSVAKERIEKLEIKQDSNITNEIEELSKKVNQVNNQSEILSNNFADYIALSEKFNETILSLGNRFSELENKITKLEQTESNITSSLKKLDTISEDVSHFRVDSLTEKLSLFDNVVSEVKNSLNGKVSENLEKNNSIMLSLQKDFNEKLSKIDSTGSSLEKIAEQSTTTNAVLNKILDKNEIDKSYLYDLLDEWSESRKLKIKK